MSNHLSKDNYELMATVLTLGMAALAKKSVDKGFEVTTGRKPPKNPEADGVSLTDAIIYTAATAAVGVAAKIIVRKILAQQWEKHDGELPEEIS
jgi:hypothetical protein